MMIIAAKIKEYLAPFLSIKGPIAWPNLFTKKANKKNLRPLVNIEVIKNINKLNWIKPLVIVNNLKGTGVNPAIKRVII